MFYIHQAYCISPQQTYPKADWNVLHESKDNQLKMAEPAYENLPRTVLRRMGRSVRAGVGAAFQIMDSAVDGIIIGTSTAGKEDSFSFLQQVMEYEEGLLTPTSFVQSTSNAVASQIGILKHNTSYNITHVHEGLAFENAMLDVALLLHENPGNAYLLGGVDELSDYDFNLNRLAGYYKKEIISNKELYEYQTPGTIAGEGAAMFLANNNPTNAIAKIVTIKTSFTTDAEEVQHTAKALIAQHNIDIFISGENGDIRQNKFYTACEKALPSVTTKIRFKHLCGEYPTASAFGLFLACDILDNRVVPDICIESQTSVSATGNILIYNNYLGKQHSFIVVANPGSLL